MDVHACLTCSVSKFAIALFMGGVAISAAAAQPVPAHPPEVLTPPPPLSTVPVPPVPGLDAFLANTPDARKNAIALGKALFWDVQMGSDGQACGSCHFHAGADDRGKHVISPGLNHQIGGVPAATATTFDPTASANPKSGANYTVNLLDFPFTQFNDPNDRNSGLKFDTDDVASSPGTFAGAFVSVNLLRGFDKCDRNNVHPIFNVNGIGTRRVEPRNTPTMINAVFNFRNFWDGRANNIFNGNNPFGLRDVNATVIKLTGGVPDQNFKVSLPNSSLASQAVGPALSDFEASCAGRNFGDLGAKLLPKQPLALQSVSPTDSVLGGLKVPFGKGIVGTYANLVQAAFNPDFWAAPGLFPVRKGLTSTTRDSAAVYTQMQANFSLFWGLAIQLYESTLISDRAPYDLSPRDANGFPTALSPQEQLGLKVFINQTGGSPFPGVNAGHCINCHKGSVFTGAGQVLQAQAQEGGLVERMIMGDNNVALYDNGFYNIGETKTENDIGVGGTDPFGNPLSFPREYKGFLAGNNNALVDRDIFGQFRVDPCTFEVLVNPANCSTPPGANDRDAVDGAFKTPGLRNVEFTGPYMHSGSMATLEQVVTAYNRGQNFRNNELDPNIEPLGLTPEEQAGLVAFMKTLTDPRVPNEAAPFDHPQINVPNGHRGDENAINARNPSKPTIATDDFRLIKATGASGRGSRGPIHRFDECIGSDPIPGFSYNNNYDCLPNR